MGTEKSNIIINVGKKIISNIEKKTGIFMFLVLVFISAIVYNKFIFGEYLYIYGLEDTACDSIKQTIPILLHNSNYIEEYGEIPAWSFSAYLGIGANALVTDVISMMLTYLNEDILIYLLVYVQCIKIIISGMFFFYYLQELGRSKYSSIIFALAYAFCGHMIARGGWQGYPTEVMCVAILLFFEEKSMKYKKYYYITFAFAFLTVNLKLYYFVLYSILVVGYFFFRKWMEGVNTKLVLVEAINVILGILIGGLIAGIVLYPEIVMQSQGARIQEGISHFYTIFNFPKSHLLKYNVAWESFLRSFSWDMLSIRGSEGNRVGSQILTAPLFYIGIFPLVLIVEGFFVLEKGKKIWYFGSMILCFSMVIFSYPRYLLTGLQFVEYFKLGYFWVVVLLLFWCSDILDSIIQKRMIKVIPLVLISSIYIGIIIYTMILNLNKFNNLAAVKSILFIILYGILIVVFVHSSVKSRTYLICIFNLILIETILATICIWYNRDIVTKEEWGNYVYTEEMQSIINYIKENNNEFYRIDRQEVFGSLCDSLVYNYYGTQSYLGGNTHSFYAGDFLESINAPLAERGKMEAGKNNFSFIYGFKNVSNIDTLLGVKYYISNSYKSNKFGYEPYYTYKNYYVFSNKYSLPLAFVYDSYLLREDFDKLDVLEKRDTLLKYCVVNGIEQNLNVKRVMEPEIMRDADLYQKNCEVEVYFDGKEINDLKGFEINSKNSNVLQVACKNSDNSVMPVIAFNCTVLDDTYARLFIYDEGGNKDYNSSIPIFLAYGENNFKFEIPYKNVPQIDIELLPDTLYQFSGFTISQVDDEYFLNNYVENVNERKSSPFYIRIFENDYIEGNINLDADKILFFSIPYDKGWTAIVDGKKTMLDICNIGFMSLALTEGEHDIILKYTPQGFDKGIVLTICGLMFCIIWIIYDKYVHQKRAIRTE